MPFLNTEPAAIHRLGSARSWAPFKVTDPRRIQIILGELCRAAIPLTLGVVGGRSVAITLWSVDELNRRLSFNTAAEAATLHELVATPGLWAAGYLQDVKLQFELTGMTLGGAGSTCIVQAPFPQHMFRLPRRQALRVSTPTTRPRWRSFAIRWPPN